MVWICACETSKGSKLPVHQGPVERKKEGKERERKRLKLRYVFLLHFSNEMTYLFSVFSDLEADGACRRTTRTGFLWRVKWCHEMLKNTSSGMIHPRKLTWIPKIAIFEGSYILKPPLLASMLDFRMKIIFGTPPLSQPSHLWCLPLEWYFTYAQTCAPECTASINLFIEQTKSIFFKRGHFDQYSHNWCFNAQKVAPIGGRERRTIPPFPIRNSSATASKNAWFNSKLRCHFPFALPLEQSFARASWFRFAPS